MPESNESTTPSGVTLLSDFAIQCKPRPWPSTNYKHPNDPFHFRCRHHPHLFISRKRSLSVDEPSSLPAHVGKQRLSASNRLSGAGRFGIGVKNRIGKRAGRVKLTPGENRPVSSPLTRRKHTRGPPTTECRCPRTVKSICCCWVVRRGTRGN